MADKIPTVVLKVDVNCLKCYKKIRKALCKFNEIQNWSFDEKQKKVTISGPFNPECLVKKLYCKVGCKIIKGHEIILPKEADQTKKRDPPQRKEAEPLKKDDPPPQKEAKPPKTTDPSPSEVKERREKCVHPKRPPEPVYVGPVYVGPICFWCCRPCFQGRGWAGYCTSERGGYYNSCCRDCSEGRPWDGPCTRGGYDSSCRFFSDDDFSCKAM